jgi:hypothetical protein
VVREEAHGCAGRLLPGRGEAVMDRRYVICSQDSGVRWISCNSLARQININVFKDASTQPHLLFNADVKTKTLSMTHISIEMLLKMVYGPKSWQAEI